MQYRPRQTFSNETPAELGEESIAVGTDLLDEEVYGELEPGNMVGPLPRDDQPMEDDDIQKKKSAKSGVCLFVFAKQFEGKPCTDIVINGVCHYHWQVVYNIGFTYLEIGRDTSVNSTLQPAFLKITREPLRICPFVTTLQMIDANDQDTFAQEMGNNFEFTRKYYQQEFIPVARAFTYMVRSNNCKGTVEDSELVRILNRTRWLKDQQILVNNLYGLNFLVQNARISEGYQESGRAAIPSNITVLNVESTSLFDTPLLLSCIRSTLSLGITLMDVRPANIQVHNNGFVIAKPIQLSYSPHWRKIHRRKENEIFTSEMKFESPTLLSASGRPGVCFWTTRSKENEIRILPNMKVSKRKILPEAIQLPAKKQKTQNEGTSNDIDTNVVPLSDDGTGDRPISFS